MSDEKKELQVWVIEKQVVLRKVSGTVYCTVADRKSAAPLFSTCRLKMWGTQRGPCV